MKTLNDLRAAHPTLATSTTCRLVGEHLVAGTDRYVPRVVANPGQTPETVAASLGVRLGRDRAERRSEAFQDAATVAIDHDDATWLAVPV